MDEPLVSIIMRSFNEGWALRETLPALREQNYRNWELIVIDSGSTDGSVELIQKAKPAHFIQIRPHEYNPSRVMNQGMRLARSRFGIFLNADATPVGPNWLGPLVAALDVPNTAAVFGRQVPRPDCRAVFAHDYERCFGGAPSATRRYSRMPFGVTAEEQRASAGLSCQQNALPESTPESSAWEHFFSMVSSGLRKDVWARRGFTEKLQYSEDDEYTRWCRSEGYRVVYVPESVAVHSHNYTAKQAYKRLHGESKALAAVWTRGPQEINWRRTFFLGWLNDMRRDLAWCAQHGRLGEFPHAALIRFAQRRARVEGFREGWKHYRAREAQDAGAAGAGLCHRFKPSNP